MIINLIKNVLLPTMEKIVLEEEKMNAENKKLGKYFWSGKNKVLALVIGGIVIAASIAVWASVQDIGERSISEKNPFFGASMDYYVPLKDLSIKIMTCYDNTDVMLDYNGDGIWDYNFNKDSGMTTNIGNLPASAHIRGSKPIIVWIEYYNNFNYGQDYEKTITTIPSASELSTYYVVPYGSVGTYPAHSSTKTYLTAIYSDTYIWVDTNNDGTYDIQQYLAPGHPLTMTTSDGARIDSDKPILGFRIIHYWEHQNHYGSDYSYSFLTKPEKSFYLPFNDKPYRVTVLQDSTIIYIDSNCDGTPDEQHTLNKGEHIDLTDYTSGTKVYSSKEFTVVSCKAFPEGANGVDCAVFTFPVISSKKMGTDFFLRAGAWIVPAYSNTTIYLDNDNDGVYESSQSLIVTQPELFSTYHIHTDKPVGVYIYKENLQTNEYYAYGDAYPSAAIITATDISPNEVGLNDEVTEQITIANPTETNVTNVTLKAYIPSSFNVNDPLTINIVKKNLYDDSVISSDEINVSPTLSSGNYEIEIDKSNSSLFAHLDNHEYYYITFSATSPSTEAVYTFKPVEVTYDADTWIE